MTEKGHPAYALALVVCDSIHRDQATGKCSIIGTFSMIGARAFPTVHPKLSVYLALTDGRGTLPYKIRIVDADEEIDPLSEVEIELTFDDPRKVQEIGLEIQGIRFPQEGEYRLQLWGGEEFIIERRIMVSKIEA